MTATLTITLSDEILKALKEEKSITVAVNSGGGGAAPAPRAARATRAATARAPRTGKAARPNAGPFRTGSLPAKLVAWATGRNRPFGVPDVVKKFRIKRGHASMLITYVSKAGAVNRVGRGEYAAA
jgi:nucleoid-associated protein YgaU